MTEMGAAVSNIHTMGRQSATEADACHRAITAAIMCEKCRPTAFKDFTAFESKLQNAIDAGIDKVRINIALCSTRICLTTLSTQVADSHSFTVKDDSRRSQTVIEGMN